MEHYEFIAAFGRTMDTAAFFSGHLGRKITSPDVSKWKKKGIPWPYRFMVKKLADDRGIEIPKGFFGIGS